MNPRYTAYATLSDGAAAALPFGSFVRACQRAERIFEDGGACFVVSHVFDEVVFNTHESLLAVLTHAGRSAQPDFTESALHQL